MVFPILDWGSDLNDKQIMVHYILDYGYLELFNIRAALKKPINFKFTHCAHYCKEFGRGNNISFCTYLQVFSKTTFAQNAQDKGCYERIYHGRYGQVEKNTS